MTVAMSSGRPRRPIGVAAMRPDLSESPRIGVSMKPGCTEFTRTPSFAHAGATVLVSRRTAPLAAW